MGERDLAKHEFEFESFQASCFIGMAYYNYSNTEVNAPANNRRGAHFTEAKWLSKRDSFHIHHSVQKASWLL